MAGTITGTVITSTYTLTTDPTTVTSTGTVDVNSTVAGVAGIYGPSGTAWTLTNLGVVESVGSFGTGISLASGGLITNGSFGAGGLIEGSGIAIDIAAGLTTINNYGSIISTTGTSAGKAIRLAAGTVINQAGGLIDGGQGNAIVGKAGGAAITVINSGIVQNSGTNSAIYSRGGGAVTNTSSATIQSTRTAISFNNTAGTTPSVGFVSNAGTIQSTGVTTGAGVYFAEGGSVANRFGGLITAYKNAVSAIVGGSAVSVSNFGIISGTGATVGQGIFLGAGGQVTNNLENSLITGAVRGVDMAAAGTVSNYGTISTSSTAGGQAILMTGGGAVSNGFFALIDSTGGNAIGSGAGTNGLALTITNNGTIQSLNSPGATVYLSHGGAVINGSGGLIKSSNGNAVSFGNTVIPGASFGNVNNAGTIQSLGTFGVGVNFGQGGSLLNQNTGLITSYRVAVGIYGTAASTVSNSGIIKSTSTLPGVSLNVSGSTILNTGTIAGRPAVSLNGTNELVGNGTLGGTLGLVSGYLTGILSSATTSSNVIVNYGTITATTTINGNAVSMNGGTVRNSGLIVPTAGTGVLLNAAGYVTNAFGGVIQGSAFAVFVSHGAGTVANAGAIRGTGAAGNGVYFGQGGLVTNQLGGFITGSKSGVVLAGTAGTVDNFATISSTAAVQGAGIELSAGGVVFNETGGLISAIKGAISIDGSALAGTSTSVAAIVTNHGKISGRLGIGIGRLDLAQNTIDNFGTIASTSGTLGTAINLGTIGGQLVVIETQSSLVGVIGNMHVGDRFDLPFMPFDPSGTATLGPNNQLQVVENGATFTIALDPVQNFSGDVFQLGTDSAGTGSLVTEQVACFRRGTRILTDAGEVPVEELSIGRHVATLSGELRVIKWVGRRAYDGRFIDGNRSVLPIRIAAGALGGGLPVRDLWLSPEHALYLDGVLVAARLLLNGTTIVQARQVEALEYFHIELDDHDVLLAEGVPAESYVECDNRAMFHNAAEFALLYPHREQATGRFCAPRVEEGAPVLDAIRARLGQRAAGLPPARAA